MTRNTECSALARLRKIDCLYGRDRKGRGTEGEKNVKGKNGISREEYILISSSKVPANYRTASVVIERYIEIALPYQRALKGRPNVYKF